MQQKGGDAEEFFWIASWKHVNKSRVGVQALLFIQLIDYRFSNKQQNFYGFLLKLVIAIYKTVISVYTKKFGHLYDEIYIRWLSLEHRATV